MRRGIPFALFLTMALALATPSSFAQPTDAGVDAGTAVAAPSEPLHVRIGKALVFGVVATALLVAGSVFTRGRKVRRRR